MVPEWFKNIDIQKNTSIENQIHKVMNEIEKEYTFQWNTLKNLLNFKLAKAKEGTLKSSNDYRNALIKEIEEKAISWEIISNNKDILWTAKYEALANKIIEVSKLTKDIQKWIQNLRAEILQDSFQEMFLSSSYLQTKWLYSREILARIDDPKTLWDNLMWLWIGTLESLVIVWKFTYDIGKWIILTPYHIIEIIRWKGKYNGIEI